MSTHDDEVRFEETIAVDRFERLVNSKSGNPRWEFRTRAGKYRRTRADAQAGLDVQGIVDGLEGRWDKHARLFLHEPVLLVLSCAKFGGVMRVRVAEVER